jgi:hypothetical protein
MPTDVLSLRALNRALLAGHTSAMLTIEMFASPATADREAIAAQAGRLLGFAAPGDDHGIMFAPHV